MNCKGHKREFWTLQELETEFYETHLDDTEFDLGDYTELECGVHYEFED